MKASTATAPSAATYLRRALRVRSTTTTTNATVLSLLLLAILATMTLVRADVYLHNPRGSNNRLNENGDNRNNANRMFDSQNNNKGGYNVGDRGTDAFETNAPLRNNLVPAQTLSKMYDASYRDMDRQGNTGTTPTANTPYPMVYLEGSILPVEWTNQHGCGGHESNDPSKTNCDIIMQYMCETGYGSASANPTIIRGAEELRDGYNTGTPDTVAGYKLVMQDTDGDSNRNNGRGRHESEMYYYECTRRSRNQGLFTADQNLGGNTAATRTRQNPNGGRSGLECPEERDYYPYWNPSPWRDIVILTDHPELMCNADGTFKGASQNNVEVSGCFPTLATTGAAQIDTALSKITQTQCSSATGAQWMTFKHNLPAPGCMKAPYSRSNHLGNGENGTALTYSWSLPMISTLRNTGVRIQTVGTQDFAKCVFRLRYNISTDDYNPYTTGSEKNGADKSPVTTDPTIDIGSSVANIKLDVDTAQFGRVFQDRSHTFYIVSRPTAWASRTIYNLNIRGRRGNIVQVYPAVEYDFVPRTTTLQGGDLVHIQWTGSNTSPDGAGQGAINTDRNNFAQMLTYGDNYPLPYDRFPDNIFSRSTCYMINGTTWGTNVNDQTPDGVMGPRAVDCALFLWTSGYFLNKDDYLAQSTRSPNVNLDKAPASLVGGIVMEIRAPAVNTTYPILSSRNNAFSNRAEKGWIIASP